MAGLWAWLGLLVGCGVAPAEVGALAQIPPDARRVRLALHTHPALTGSYARTQRHPRSVGTSDPAQHHTWVMPVSDGPELDPVVQAWLTSPGFLRPDQVQAWQDSAREALAQGHPVQVGGRLGQTPDSAREQAVQAALAAHGLSSAPGAPILVFPLP